MKKYVNNNLGKIIGYLYIVIGLLLIVSNSIDVYANFSKEEKLLSDFYERDKAYSDMEEIITIVEHLKNEVPSNEDSSTEIIVEPEKEKIKEEKTDALKDNDYDEYVSVLKIPKINLEKGLFAKSSKYNDIEYNIMIHEKSDTPNVNEGNVILVAHSGTSSVSYFRNLNKLKLGDTAEIYYHGKKYTYKVADIYEVEKTGTVQIKRNSEKNTLTMITCVHNTDKQIVFIAELSDVDTY